MVNVTLTADEKLVARARAYAVAHNTTLNQLVRDYLGRLTGQLDLQQAAAEFAAIARNQPGRSEEGYRFDRKAAHARGEGRKR